ncbi:MAG: hypothetical protein IKT00_01065 [Prevotella sp.]|nr:hypothetical protein [Prevotella sp.]
MTQYRCPRCGNSFTGNAMFCPHCGTQISNTQPQAPQKKNNTFLYVLIGLLMAACLGLGLWLFLSDGKDSPKQPSKIEAKAQMTQEETAEESPSTTKEETKADVEEKTPQQPTQAQEQRKSSSNGVYMGMWGRIGDSDQAEFEMNGTTGTYSYVRQGQNSGKRSLRLVSYNEQSGRCIIDAFAAGKKIGTFDGTFREISETDDEGEEHYGQSYNGKFKSTNGAQLDFMLYFD